MPASKDNPVRPVACPSGASRQTHNRPSPRKRSERAARVVRTHRRQCGEADGRQRCGHGHLDDMLLWVVARGQDDGQERHHQHAATDAEPTGQKAGDEAQQGQLQYQGEGKVHKRNRCLQRPPSRILNRGSGGRGQRWRRVHLTRDDHTSQAMFQARATRALVQGIKSPMDTADKIIVEPCGRKPCSKTHYAAGYTVAARSYLISAGRLLSKPCPAGPTAR